jgi:transporter family protein
MCAALFAALTTIFAKLGLAGVNPDFATLIRTAVVLILLAILVMATGKWSNPLALPPRTLGFLLLSALATGA